MEKLSRLIIKLLLLALVLSAIVVIALRLALGNIDYFKSDIENWLASELAPGISFTDIQGEWKQLNPTLRLSDVSVLLPNRSQALAIQRITIEFDLWKSLNMGSPVVAEIFGHVSKLSLRKDEEQQWWFNDIKLIGQQQEGAGSKIQDLIGQIPVYLRLNLDRLILFEQSSGKEFQIDKVRVDAQQRDASHYLRLSANLPESLGEWLEVKSIIGEENSLVYLRSNRLQLEPLASLFAFDSGALRQAEIGGEVWLNFLENQSIALNGNLSILDGVLQTLEEQAPLPFSLEGQFSLVQLETQWNITGRFKNLSIRNQLLQGFDTELRVARSTDRPPTISGWIDNFELYNLRVLEAPMIPQRLASILERSKLSGQVNSLWFNLEAGDLDSLQLMAEADNLSSDPVDGIPGVNHVEGSLVYGNGNAGLDAGSIELSLDFAEQFRAPFDIDQVTLQARMSILEDSLLLSVPRFDAINSDLRAEGRLWLETTDNAQPFLYMRAQMEDGNGSSTPRYLPIQIMPEAVVDWLDSGIRTAEVSNANFLFHGRLESIQTLQQNRSGEMMVDFDVADAEILFQPGWSSARQGQGHVLFHNMGVNIDLEQVSFESVEQASAQVAIANFKQPVVEIRAKTSTTASQALQTWIATPIGRSHEAAVKHFRDVEGEVLADLAISLPLSSGNLRPKVKAAIEMRDAAMKAPTWGLELSKVNGGFEVTESNISGDGIKAVYYQDPVNIRVATDQANNLTMIKTSGHLDSKELFKLLPDYLTQGISGSSDWNIDLGIANNQSDETRPIVRIDASSDLKATLIDFPQPFKKPIETSRASSTEISFFKDDSIRFKIDYGVDIKALGKLQPGVDNDLRLAWLGLGLSTGVMPSSTSGIKINGRLDKLPLDEWIDYYQTRIAKDSAEGEDFLRQIDTIDLDLKTTSYHGRSFTDTHLVMIPSLDGFTGTIESSLLKGNFMLPLNQRPENPIVADLEYLKLEPNDSENGLDDLMPDSFHNMKLTSRKASYGETTVNDLRYEARIQDHQLTVDKLEFRHGKVILSSSATWQYLPESKQQHSGLSLSITGKELGQTLAALGFGDTMHDGSVNMDGQIRWTGGLFKMDWDSLIGDARLEIADGILKNIEPGSGRFVGLLSLNALPRRLALDFNDVLFEGLSFDKISGSYYIEGENLYTENTTMDGASAEVKISGIIGLRQRNYDQTMLVIPKIRQTLPLIGGLAAGNAVGWGLLLIQNLFKKAIDKSVEVEYKVTGGWDDPQVELVKKVVIKNERVQSDK